MGSVMFLYTALFAWCSLVGVRGGGIDYYSDPPQHEIEEAFKKHGIVPRVLDEAPKKYLFVKYRLTVDNFSTVHYVRLGNDVHPFRADALPEDVIWEPEPGVYYTLLHLGPNVVDDDDTKIHDANFLHFAKVNIQGNRWQETGHVIADYIGPRPYPQYGRLAYTYLLYKQPKLIDFPETYDIDDYKKSEWQLRDFLKKHKITELISGNFYTSEATQEKFASLLTVEPDDYETVSPKMLRK